MTLTSGDIVDLDLGLPEGREAGFRHPAVVVTSQATLDGSPSVVHVVPVTSTVRPFASEVQLEADPSNGLDTDSAAQCQHLRAAATTRIAETRGNVGPAKLAEIREVIGLLLDIPS